MSEATATPEELYPFDREKITAWLDKILDRSGVGVRLTPYVDEPIGLVMADVDDFIRLNDQYGHPTGDDVLEVLIARLAAMTPPEYIAVRVGGDEFCAFLPGVTDIAVAQNYAVTLLHSMEEPVVVGEHTLNVRYSIGVSIAPPGDLARGLYEADVAMYQAKARGRARAASLNPDWET